MSKNTFTDDLLAENFTSLTKFSNDVVDTLSSLTTLAERTEIRLSVLEKLASRPVVVKSSKLLVLTAMGISFYAGYKYATSKLIADAEQEAYTEDLLERNRNKADHPAGKQRTDYSKPKSDIPNQHEVKINGTNDPRPES